MTAWSPVIAGATTNTTGSYEFDFAGIEWVGPVIGTFVYVWAGWPFLTGGVREAGIEHRAWTANPKPYSAWIMVDGMARHSIGQENTEERANALLPPFLVSSPEVAEPLIATNGWPGPDSMADQFAALWGVG